MSHNVDEERVGTARNIQPNDEVDLIKLLIIVAKHKKLVLGLPLFAGLLAAAVTILMPNVYTGTARILPPQQNQSAAAALLGQLGGLGGVAAGSLGIKNPADLYVGMLKSRSVADALIERFGLQALYQKETLDDTRRVLADLTTISAGRDGIITVQVDDHDPRRAADLANAYLEQLEKLNERLALTEAAQRRLFFEKQLHSQKDALAVSEVSLQQTQEKTGLIKLDEQGRVLIEALAQVRAQIAAKEVQLDAMRSFTTDRNPDRIRAEAELAGLRDQLSKLERRSGTLESGTFVSAGRVPEVGLEYVRKLRDVKYHETLFELLAKQYELARLDESKEASIIQVLDRAVAPERKSAPKRTIIVLVTGIAVGMLALILAFIREAWLRARTDPARAEQMVALREHLRVRPSPPL